MNKMEALSVEQLEVLKTELEKARKARTEATQSAGDKVFAVYSR
ncbi:hypothetical protein [Salinispora mooreana]|nr:hypothetical protein [Salinispora mooreana]